MTSITYKALQDNKQLVTMHSDCSEDMYRVDCLDSGERIEILHLNQTDQAVEKLNDSK